ncbi:unnamed protein product [Leptidea sinapis]|uniref:Uncharacterized protein n=1 Tax=Leptidea sinapis TaxID=189913 RepID=A0A5E4QKH7_9NEOP|nr:unnamed protein product [Leptidea sinapis]
MCVTYTIKMDTHKYIKQEDIEQDIQVESIGVDENTNEYENEQIVKQEIEERKQETAGWFPDWQLGMIPQEQSDCDVSVNQLCKKQLRVNLVRLENYNVSEQTTHSREMEIRSSDKNSDNVDNVYCNNNDVAKNKMRRPNVKYVSACLTTPALIDTGASSSCMSASTADLLGLKNIKNTTGMLKSIGDKILGAKVDKIEEIIRKSKEKRMWRRCEMKEKRKKSVMHNETD